MDTSYSVLLDRTRVPQPSLQRFAVIQIFDKLRSTPASAHHSLSSGREAVTQCLHSLSSAVVDQSVHELCRLVKHSQSQFSLSYALLELQSALEDSNPRFVNVFVQGIGFLVRFGFRRDRSLANDSENHPFVKVLSCRPEVQNELVQQVLLFVVHCKQYGIGEVCDYLRPVVTFSILRGCSSDSSLSSFLRLLISSLTSLCCSPPYEANPLFEMLVDCLRCFHYGSAEDFRNFVVFAEFLVDSHIVLLRHLAKSQLMVHEAQLSGVKLLDTLLTVCMEFEKHFIGSKAILELSRRLLNVQKELRLQYLPELVSPMLSLFVILTQLELEDDELFVLNLLTFFLKWKAESGNVMDGVACDLDEMLLFVFPIMKLIASPSKSVKLAASQFLLLLEKHCINNLTPLREELFARTRSLLISKTEMIIFGLLKHLWLQDLPPCSFFLNIFFVTGNDDIMEYGSKFWISRVTEYAVWITERRKPGVSVSYSPEVMSADMPLLLSALVCVLGLHHSLGSSAVETFGPLSNMEPKLGVTLLLAILYYLNLVRGNIKCCSYMLLKLLAVLPSLASHSAMLPLIVQTIIPMLREDSNPVLYGTALRLLCKAWEMNDRIFPSLYELLLPECFIEFGSDITIAISMAASLRDICRRNPDRGVELILSVAVCIECRDSVIKALGFQSLGYLCEADVVDFYTAWDVIEKHAKDYSMDPIVAYSLCLLLKYGAMDAEAYIEDSRRVLQILWDVGSSDCPTTDSRWKKARVTALDAINHYQVMEIEKSIHDFKGSIMNLLTKDTEIDILRAIGKLQLKVFIHEHSTRQRFIKEKRSPTNKIEKLVDAFPRVMFSSGPSCNAKELPGAALLCFPFNSREANSQWKSRNARDIFGEYHTMLKEIAASLHLSRNTVLALLSLQSWKHFLQHWLKDYISYLDVKASSTVLDQTSKAANDVLKSMIQVAENSVPRVVENIGLAIGAFCMVLPASVHPVKVAASKYLLNYLFQYEHEHNQWSAAISLGVISSCLHITDHEQKLQIVNGLVEVACTSRNSLVKGACGVGLGYSCQDLLTRAVSAENAPDHGSFTLQEKTLLRKIIRTLSSAICNLSKVSSDILESLAQYTPPGLDDIYVGVTSELIVKGCDDVAEDIWGVAGLVLGLGTSVSALLRAGSYDAMSNIKVLCMSWISQADSIGSCSSISSQNLPALLGTAACLVLPTVALFCRKVEMMHDTELDDLLCSYENLISKLLLVKTSNIFHQNLLMASCVGAGSLLAWILDEGLLSLNVQRIKNLLESFKRIYSDPHHHLIHLGGMLGVVNAMGAQAGSIVHYNSSTINHQTIYQAKESSYVNVPLLLSPSFEKNLLELTQDIFLVAQKSDNEQLQAFAAWTMSFLNCHIWSKELQGLDECIRNKETRLKPLNQSFSEDSAVVMLSSWVMHLDHSNIFVHANTVAAVLRCLSHAPRLPKLDWGAVVRRCMRYGAHIARLSQDSFHEKRTLSVECLQFSLAHANNFDSLLASLDELTDLSRFRTLDLVMQSCLLFHLPDLLRIFSSARVQKLLVDISEYLSSPISPYQKYNAREKTFLQLSCWKGLRECFSEGSPDTSQYLSSMENCMEVLFYLLPPLPMAAYSKQRKISCLDWFESVACLAKARRAWLLDLLQISEMDIVEKCDHFHAVVKKILAMTRLVKLGFLPMTELAKLTSYLLNSKSEGMWEVLVEVVTVLQAAKGSVKRQWLLNVLEISCMTKYPSMALQFLGLLSGSCCKYMPLLVLDPQDVLNDLPVTLSSLLSSANWRVIAETAVSHLLTSTERIYFNCSKYHGCDDSLSLHPIDPSETEMCSFLLRVMLDACTELKKYLPLKKQLRLANMIL